MNSHSRKHRTRGFSLIELVIVVVIIGIIAAIAIPRMSRGSAGAADSALLGDLAVLRNAIDLYHTEHVGAYPTAGAIVNQLTQYTDPNGDAQAAKDSTHIYGPYLRSVPPLPVGTLKGKTGITTTTPAGTDTTAGWLYDATSGDIVANLADAEADVTTKPYNSY